MGLLRTHPQLLDVFTARHLPVVGARADLAPCRLGRLHRGCLFLDPVCSRNSRHQAARPPVRLGLLGVRGLHHGVRPDACAVDLHALGPGLWHRGHRQGGDGGGVGLHGWRALAAAAEDPDDPLPVPASKGPGRARTGGNQEPRRDAAAQAAGRCAARDAREHDAPHRRRRDRGRRRDPVRRASPHSAVQSGLRTIVRLSRRRGHESRHRHADVQREALVQRLMRGASQPGKPSACARTDRPFRWICRSARRGRTAI